jgi:hypothetical protein
MMMAMENKIIQNFTKQQNLCASFQHKQGVEWRGVEWSGVEKERAAAGSKRPDPPTLQMPNANAHSSLPLLLLLLFLFKN